MFPRFRLTVTSFMAALVTACATGSTPATDPPDLVATRSPEDSRAEPAVRLIVALPIDQLRPDLLDLYDHLFTGGLRRIRDQGLHHPNGTHDHAATATAVGHTTLGTGVYPTRHGIVGNEWRERVEDQWRTVYAVADSTVSIVGHPSYPGRSPANLYRGGLGDWLLAHSPESRVAAVAGKDRTAIPMSGTARGDVYWLLVDQGEFVTSTWYRDSYPDWVTRFNRERMPELYGDTVWESTVPPEAAHLTLPDSSTWEGPGGGRFASFPHRATLEATGVDEDRLRHNRWRGVTPFGGDAILAFAEEMVRQLELGRRGVTDYLTVGLSQTDWVGHRYGPLSREQLDTLLRLDRGLGRFLAFLDDTVGEGRWVLGLSADHGVMDAPEDLARRGFDAGRVGGELTAELSRIAENAAAANGASTDRDERADRVAAALQQHPDVGVAVPLHRLEAGATGDTIVDLFRNSYSRDRTTSRFREYDIQFAFREGLIATPIGSTHGSPYFHDRWVPITFVGPGVRPGVSPARAATVDFAPTLAALAGIPVPDDLDGEPLIRPR